MARCAAANDNGRAAAYESLHINTSRDVTGFSDFPIPKSLPHFLHHRQLLDYFERYVERFGFGPTIRFRTRVEHVAPAAAGGYDVTTRDLATGETQRQRYGAVLVANGHHWDPALPEIPGTFGGVTLHSHAYRTPEIGRRLHRLFRHAGFRDVEVKVLANADVKGHTAPIVWNMLAYARASGRMPAAELDAIAAELEQALAEGEFLLLLPQFLATGVASEGGRS